MRGAVSWCLALFLLAGCGKGEVLPYARELGDAALVRTVGLDAWGEGVRLTASWEDGAGEGHALSAAAPSVAAAAQAARGLSDRYVAFGHANRLLLGEELATCGLAEVLDYLAREPQLGPGMQVWIVRGEAERAAETARVSRRLDRLSVEEGVGCSAARLMSVLARRGSVCVPALRVVSVERGGKETEQILVPDGYAVLRQGRLVCFTDEETTCGVEVMEEKNGGNAVTLELADGTAVGVMTERARVRCRPVFRDGALAGLDVRCRLNARVVQGGRRLNDREMDELVERLERMLGEGVVRAVELGQYWDADFLDLERRARLAAPHKKAEIQRQWPELFRSLALRVEVLGRLEQMVGAMEEGG